jgi:hypothetical protein
MVGIFRRSGELRAYVIYTSSKSNVVYRSAISQEEHEVMHAVPGKHRHADRRKHRTYRRGGKASLTRTEEFKIPPAQTW